jgi:hypothetical protein
MWRSSSIMRPSSSHSLLERHSASSCSLGTTGGVELVTAWLGFRPKTLKTSLLLELRHPVQVQIPDYVLRSGEVSSESMFNCYASCRH